MAACAAQAAMTNASAGCPGLAQRARGPRRHRA
jgi:hypothetical protein